MNADQREQALADLDWLERHVDNSKLVRMFGSGDPVDGRVARIRDALTPAPLPPEGEAFARIVDAEAYDPNMPEGDDIVAVWMALAELAELRARALTDEEATGLAAWLNDYGLENRIPGLYAKLAGGLTFGPDDTDGDGS